MIIYFVIFAAIVARFVPHMPNLAPVTALAIFSAANMGWKKSVALTLAVRLISDIFLGFFAWPLMLAVYASHLVGILFGLWIRRGGDYRWAKIITSSLFASVIFFLVTNFAFLYSGYTHDIAGVTSAYVNGLPFFRGTLFGDLGYSVALFGGYEFVKSLVAQRTKLLASSF
jgi:hypothetical protein